MMLAEISTGELVSNGVALGLFVVALVALFKKNDVKVEQPITVKVIEALHDKFASKVEFDRQAEENKREHENLFSKIGGVDRGFAQKVTNEVTAIHARINLLDKSSGRLEATTELQNEQLSALDKKLDGIPDRVIATLKNTGAI